MSKIPAYVQHAFRFVAVLAGVVALAGVGAFAVVGLFVAEQSGMAVPGIADLTTTQAERLLVSGGVAVFAGIVLNLVANTVASFAAGFREAPARPGEGVTTPTDEGASSGASSPEQAGSGASRPPASERYLAKLQRTYLFLSGTVALLAVLGVASGATGRSVGSVVEVIFFFAELTLALFFGGLAGALGVLVVLLGLWYGASEAASEAIVVGLVIALLFLPTAVVLGSFGLVLFSLTMLYYNLLARGATEFRWVTADAVPGTVRRFVG